MNQDFWKGGQRVDLSNCAQEPIHVPGKIQPHGVLLALSTPDWVIRHASANTEQVFGFVASGLVGRTLDAVISSRFAAELKEKLSSKDFTDVNPLKIEAEVNGETAPFDAIVHRSNDLLILELERTLDAEADVSFSNIYRKINSTLRKIEAASTVTELCRVTAEQAKLLSGFHRVMVYQFDQHWNGKVVAEAKEPRQAPFLGLQYPSSDIPAQARALYRTNWIRLIPKVDYRAVDIVPAVRPDTLEPLDLSFSVLRSVSPMHVQYLKNMDVGASMSVSVITDNNLWGLIAFHHDGARYLPYELRQGLEFIGKHFSLQLTAKERHENSDRKLKLKSLQPRLCESMRKSAEFLSGLHRDELDFLQMAEGATGGAICYRDKIALFGSTPTQAQIAGLVGWLKKTVGQAPVFQTTSLAASYEPAAAFKDTASGLLCLSIPEPDPSYVLWFKPEVIQTVNWSGNPEKPVEISGEGTRLGPRASFALWQETVKLKSLPWGKEEVEAIEELRRSIIEVDLERQVSAAMRSNAELDQFAHLVAHDLKEPLRGIGNFAEFIRQDEGEGLKPESKRNLGDILELTEKTKRLIGTLHEYSKLGRIEFSFARVDLNQVVREAASLLRSVLAEARAELRVPRELPTVCCDQARISEVFSNLITNAIKYNAKPKKWVEIGFKEAEGAPTRFYVRDNGIGVSAENQDRIFRMFERLHEEHEFGGGSGSGLALVRKIVDRHQGRIWVESAPEEGATFYFTLAPETSK